MRSSKSPARAAWGHVYRARDLEVGDLVALKILNRETALGDVRFEREASLLAGLSDAADGWLARRAGGGSTTDRAAPALTVSLCVLATGTPGPGPYVMVTVAVCLPLLTRTSPNGAF